MNDNAKKLVVNLLRKNIERLSVEFDVDDIDISYLLDNILLYEEDSTIQDICTHLNILDKYNRLCKKAKELNDEDPDDDGESFYELCDYIDIDDRVDEWLAGIGRILTIGKTRDFSKVKDSTVVSMAYTLAKFFELDINTINTIVDYDEESWIDFLESIDNLLKIYEVL